MSVTAKIVLWVFVVFVAIGAGCVTYVALCFHVIAGAVACALSIWILAKLVNGMACLTWRDSR